VGRERGRLFLWGKERIDGERSNQDFLTTHLSVVCIWERGGHGDENAWGHKRGDGGQHMLISYIMGGH